MRNIAVLTSGGDSPGMNAAIRAISKTGLNKNIDVYGIYHGYRGLMENNIKKLGYRDVAGIMRKGGTIIKSARCPEFMDIENVKKAGKNLTNLDIDGLVVIGGDGSMKGAVNLWREVGLNVVGIPATIDNDVYGTDITLGSDTALNGIIRAVDSIVDTATSHDRTFIVEVMGRDSGYLALMSTIATGSEIALIPEKPMPISKVVKILQDRFNEGRSKNIIILAEGSGKAHELAEKINAQIPYLDVKYSVLGHIQRGGSPTLQDRILGSRMGVMCVNALIDGANGVMAGMQNNKLVFVDFKEVFENNKSLDLSIYEEIKILA